MTSSRSERAWIVRAGSNGEYERLALDEGVCVIGWSELGEIAPGTSRDELKARIERRYGEHRRQSLAMQAGEVYRFVEEVAVDDLVVLPLRSDPGNVAVGEVAGPYEHRTTGPFAGTDAQHTRPVRWLAKRVPYDLFESDLQAAFGQQGTLSRIGTPRAGDRVVEVASTTMVLHLVLKWSAKLAVDTIERHVEVAEQYGAVWWGRVSRPGTTGLAERWLDELRIQLHAGVPTSVFLHGATTWHARLLAITTDRELIEETLVPPYYKPDTHHSLWVKLTGFEQVDPDEIVARYTLASSGDPVTWGGLSNQTPLIVRGPSRADARAARIPRPAPGPERVDDPPPRRRTEVPLHPEGPISLPPPRARPRSQRPKRPLELPALEKAAARYRLRLPSETYAHVLAVLRSRRHVILTGPPGTAKTTLALAIAEAAEEAGLCDGHLPTTATADWTTYETIGGMRQIDDGSLAYEEGHFVTAIRENRWLLIDELNRSQFDRAFGQLFTVLSGHRVVLPYRRREEQHDRPLALAPAGVDPLSDRYDSVTIDPDWRIVATMNVFDKSLLFEMSFALMRRFGFVEVGCPAPDVFEELIAHRAGRDARAARLAADLLALRELKDIGPAVFMDLAGFLRERIALDPDANDGRLRFEAFYSYLLPQFEGIQERDGERLHATLGPLVGPALRGTLRRTLSGVLGLELSEQAPSVDDADEDVGEELDAA